MGRPKSDNPKSKQLAIRLDVDDLSKLDEIAEHYNISRVEALRKGINALYGLFKKKKD